MDERVAAVGGGRSRSRKTVAALLTIMFVFGCLIGLCAPPVFWSAQFSSVAMELARTRTELEHRTQIANSVLLGAADLIVGTGTRS